MQTVKDSLRVANTNQDHASEADRGFNTSGGRDPGYGAKPVSDDTLQNSNNGSARGQGPHGLSGGPDSGAVPGSTGSTAKAPYAARPEAQVHGTTASGGIIGDNLSDKPILGGEIPGAAPATPVASQSTWQHSGAETTPVTQTTKQAESRPVTEGRPVEGGSTGGPGGLPSGYAARGVNPENVGVNYAGNIGNYRNVGNHKNEGIGTNSEPNYAGNTNSQGITDKKGNPLPGTPEVGTDGDRIGGSFGQSERGRSRGFYNGKAL